MSPDDALREIERRVPDAAQRARLLAQIDRPQTVLKYLNRGSTADDIEAGLARVRQTGVPQGMTDDQFAQMSQDLRAAAGKYGDDIRVQGSRSAGVSQPGGDIDIAIRLNREEYEALVRQRFGNPVEGSSKWRSMQYALNEGKLSRGNLGLSGFGKDLATKYGFEKADISVILVGGPFDNAPVGADPMSEVDYDDLCELYVDGAPDLATLRSWLEVPAGMDIIVDENENVGDKAVPGRRLPLLRPPRRGLLRARGTHDTASRSSARRLRGRGGHRGLRLRGRATELLTTSTARSRLCATVIEPGGSRRLCATGRRGARVSARSIVSEQAAAQVRTARRSRPAQPPARRDEAATPGRECANRRPIAAAAEHHALEPEPGSSRAAAGTPAAAARSRRVGAARHQRTPPTWECAPGPAPHQSPPFQ